MALNGIPLAPETGKRRIDDANMYVWKYWIEYELPVPPLRAGVNRFLIRLAHRNPGLDGPVTLAEMKVELDYRDGDDRGTI